MSKRGKERNIRERDGKFYYRYNVKDPVTGKRKQKESRGFASPTEARREGVCIQAEMLHGTYIEEKNIMFKDWADTWLGLYASTGKVKNTTVRLRRYSLLHAQKKFAGLKLREVTRLQYQSLLKGMKAAGSAKRTIELVHETCNLMFHKAVQMELIKINPAVGAELPAFPKTVEALESNTELPKYLEKEELALLLQVSKRDESFPGKQWHHALFVMAYTGLRLGELSALKPTDIDEVNKQISVTKTLYDGGTVTGYGLNTPKTKSSIRKIDVSDTVLAILKKQETGRNQFKMSVRDRYYDTEEFIFINDQKNPGYPAPRMQFENRMRRSLQAAELPDSLTPHSLRHTYTSLMAEAGVELEAIQNLLGHKSDKITRDIYLHVTKARKKAAVEKLDKLMDGLN